MKQVPVSFLKYILINHTLNLKSLSLINQKIEKISCKKKINLKSSPLCNHSEFIQFYITEYLD